MPNQRNALKAGLFIVISLVLIVVVLVSISGLENLTKPKQTRQAVFELRDNIGGLNIGDEVRIGGYKVGEVRDIRLEGGEGGEPRIVVSYAIPRQYSLRQGARVAVETTVTGTSVLNFQSLGQGENLAEGERLRGLPSNFQVIFDNLSQVAPQIQAIASDVRTQTIPRANAALDKMGQTADAFRQTGEHATALVGEVRGKVDPIVERYNQFVDAGKRMMNNVSDVFGDVRSDFRTTVANLAVSSGALKDKLPPALDQVNQFLETTNRTVEGIREAMTDVKATVSNTKDLTGSARSVVLSNRGKFDEMIDSFKKTGDNLKYASEEIRRSPWRLLYKPKPGEMANLNVFDAARQFAEGANDLNDAAAALRDALKDPQADKQQIEKLMKRVDQSFGNFQQVEQKLWTSVKE